jgi:RNA polymerase sigma-70 factor (ECF subfamily)
MEEEITEPLDQRLRCAWDAGDYSRTATLWIEALGPEIRSFLDAMPIPGVDPDDVFAHFCEQLWLSLPRLRWGCSARTWSYLLARASWQRVLTHAKRRRNVPLSDVSEIAEFVAAARTSTAAFQQTDVKDSFRELRNELSEDDRMVLILRVDRGFDWNEAAQVMAGEERIGAEDLARARARLRKQFERIKQRIRALAEQRGLLPDED